MREWGEQLVEKAPPEGVTERIERSTSHREFFDICEKHRDLMRDIHIMVPGRPGDGVTFRLNQLLTVWYGEGIGYSLMSDHMGGFIEATRANMAYSFLKQQTEKYLLMIDNDMVPPLELPWLLARHGVGVVGAPCMTVSDQFGPILCFSIPDPKGNFRFPAMRSAGSIPAKGLREVGHIGTGALLIRRDVLESFTFESGDVPFYVPERVRISGAETGRLIIGEDIAFCNQIRAKGIPLYVDLEAHVGHRKTMTLQWDDQLRDPQMDPSTWVLPEDGQILVSR